MNTTTTSAPKSKSPKFATSEQLKKAAAIRKQAAKELNVRPSFIRIKECIQRAMGRRVLLRNCFGTTTFTPGFIIDFFLVSEDCPLIISSDLIVENTGLRRDLVQAHLAALAAAKIIGENHGFCSVLNSKRPYTNAVGEGVEFTPWMEARKAVAVEA
jgi:hypothetical protein